MDEEEYERVIIAVEGRDIGIQHETELGALTWDPDELVPITENFGTEVSDLLGKGRNIRREENGDITIEVPSKLVLRDEHGKNYADFAAYTTDVSSRKKPDGSLVQTSGRIRYVSRVVGFREGSITAANPRMPAVETHTYTISDSPKMLRETLCVAQGNLPVVGSGKHRERLQRLIDECDRKRPIGPDGKHGDRHTPECGCIDK